jgi:hypothetical protein
MRPHYLSLALLLSACNQTTQRPPPDDRFIYPSALVHRSVPGSTQGVLYVASANFDRCYDQGTMMAVELDQVGSETARLPPLGTAVSAEPLHLEQLNLGSRARVYIDSFAGEMDVWERTGEGHFPRLFIPTRSDSGLLHAIDLPEPTRLACVGAEGDDCTLGALSLVHVPGALEDRPRAASPIGIAVSPEGEVWVTHADLADSPAGSRRNSDAYMVRLRGDTLVASVSDFYSLAVRDLPLGSGHAVAIGERYIFVTGRSASSTASAQARRFLVRVMDRTDPRRVMDPGLDMGFAALDARGIVLARKNPARPERRMYVVTRAPSALLVVDVTGDTPDSVAPRLTAVGSVPLPEGASMVRLVSRQALNRSDLVVVTSYAAGVVSIYDPDVGQVVAQVPVGEASGDSHPRPYALAVQQEGNAARIFVGNFGDGRVSVIDIEDIRSPQQARLVAWLGARQDVPGSRGGSACQEANQ